MAYSNTAITGFTDILPALTTVAAAAGWAVSGSGATRNLTRPGGGAQLVVTYATGALLEERLEVRCPSLSATLFAQTTNIRINGTTSAPDVPAPSDLHLFTGVESGQAFIAGVIQFGFNRYRHFYIGNTVKRGAYAGGECFAGTQFLNSNSSGNYPANTSQAKFLFGASSNLTSTPLPVDGHGAVHVDHAGNAVKLFPNRLNPIGAAGIGFVANRVFGGANERVNEAVSAYGEMPFDAATLITPMNLYITEGSPVRARAVGHPAGARLVSMKNLAPNATFIIAGNTWRAFPFFRKSASNVVPFGTGWGADETSQYLGAAYPETF